MALLVSSLAGCAYQAALAPRAPMQAASAVSMTAITPGDIGTTRPLGVWDPLGLMTKMPDKYRRWQEMEIKHGRIAMLATLHVIVTGAGYKWAGYCSYLSFPPLKFDDIPAGTLGELPPHGARQRARRRGACSARHQRDATAARRLASPSAHASPLRAVGVWSRSLWVRSLAPT
jgi:hypothetical protein